MSLLSINLLKESQMSLSLEDLKSDLNTAFANRAQHNKDAHEAEGMIKLLQGQIALFLKKESEAQALKNVPADNGAVHDNIDPILEESNTLETEDGEANDKPAE